MKLANNTFHSIMRADIGKTLSARLALLTVQGALSGAACGQTVPTITKGQTVQGTLGGGTDAVLPDGRPIDQYRLTTQVPGQTYAIRAISPQVPLISSVSFFNPTLRRFVPLQRATVFAAGQQVLYAGALAQPGNYTIDVFPLTAQQPVGSYTLSLSCLGDDLDDDGVDDDSPDDGSDACFDDGSGGVPGAPVGNDRDDRFDD